jgi:hypothetical protein
MGRPVAGGAWCGGKSEQGRRANRCPVFRCRLKLYSPQKGFGWWEEDQF